MAAPFVSVLIDTYNHERFIEQAITSALEQDFPASDREIIVVDDGSTDWTTEIVRKFAPEVRLLRKPNGGQASAFNAGIPECKGEIVAFLDGDDWWAPAKLQSVTRVFDSDAAVGAVGHAIHEVDEGGAIRATIQPDRLHRIHLRRVEDCWEFLPLRACLGTSRFTARRALLERLLPVPQGITIEADELLFTMAVVSADVVVSPVALTYYRLHSRNLYQFRELDRARMKRKHKALACLLQELGAFLSRSKGLDPDVIRLLLRPIWIDCERLRFVLGEGWPWDAFRVERASYEMARREAGVPYRMFQAMALSASLVLPPRIFYLLRRWYSDSVLLTIRSRWAKRTSPDDITVRRVPV